MLFSLHLTRAFKSQNKQHMFCPWVSLTESGLDYIVVHFLLDSEQYQVFPLAEKWRT